MREQPGNDHGPCRPGIQNGGKGGLIDAADAEDGEILRKLRLHARNVLQADRLPSRLGACGKQGAESYVVRPLPEAAQRLFRAVGGAAYEGVRPQQAPRGLQLPVFLPQMHPSAPMLRATSG